MSETAPEPGGGEKKIAGMPRTLAIVLLAVIGGIGFIWWKNRSAANAAAGTSAADTSGIDYGGELSTLQSEYGNLASEISAMQGSTGTPGPAGPAGKPGPTGPPGPANYKPPVKVFPPVPKKKPPARKWVPARTITVPKNATLLSLSQKYLGTADRSQLAHANKLGTGAGLHAGQRLLIPGHWQS